MTARRTDPLPSHEAITEPAKRGVEHNIMWALRTTHRPLAADDIAYLLGREGHDYLHGTIVTAISRLVNAGKVRVVDNLGKSNRGRRCSRYELKGNQ